MIDTESKFFYRKVNRYLLINNLPWLHGNPVHGSKELGGKIMYKNKIREKLSVPIRDTILVFFCLIVLVATGCTPLYREVIPTMQAPPVYDQLYPYYAEVCAVSQIRAEFTQHGGAPGHAVMYLKGACRDTEAEYPTIEVCDAEAVDLSDPETGVGISVNKLLGNVNWIAIPGKRLFYRGNIEEDQLLDEDFGKETIKAVKELEIFKGVEARDYYEESIPEDENYEEYVYRLARDTLGTDFALNFGRTIFCTRVPVTREMMEKIVGYLNEQNRQYADGEADYRWSGLYNNCSHVLHNSLAAAGVWSPKRVHTYMLRQLFNLSVPANETINLAHLTTKYPIENFYKIYRDDVKRKTLLEENWLPTQHGALFQIISIHQKNELYDTRARLMVVQWPLLKPKSRKINAISDEPRFTTDLRANLSFFKDRYELILKERPDDWDDVAGKNCYIRTRKVYYEYIEQQLDDVNEKIQLLGQVD
jgi:hypothetical protein